MNKLNREEQLTLLYINIGRGHPFYLDGIVEALIRRGDIGLVRKQADVFEIARGVSALAWKFTRWLYRSAPSNQLIGTAYHALRHSSDYNRDSLSLTLLGRDIRKQFAAERGPVIVSHPTLVGILRGKPGLIYQHGELAVPAESLVRGAELVLVPTSEQAVLFIRAGYRSDQVIVTGLCIEPPLVKQATDAYTARMQRHASGAQLTGAYFSSGAEPNPHVNAIVQTSLSAAQVGHRAVIFALQNGRLAREVLRACSASGIPVERVNASMPDDPRLSNIVLVEHRSRREENALTARLFPQFDIIVSPAHERTNWGLGLGLPIFILEPCFGTFAPLNRKILLDHKVAFDLTESAELRTFGNMIDTMRARGELIRMAECGWGRYPFNGFETIATLLEKRYAQR